MNLINRNDIFDETMKIHIKEEDITEAQIYLEDLARSLGARIATPTPYKAKKLLVAHTCMTRAKYKATGVSSDPMRESRDAVNNVFELKRRIYWQEVQQLEREIRLDPTILSGKEKIEDGNVSIPLYRA